MQFVDQVNRHYMYNSSVFLAKDPESLPESRLRGRGTGGGWIEIQWVPIPSSLHGELDNFQVELAVPAVLHCCASHKRVAE